LTASRAYSDAPLYPVTQDEDGKSDCEPEESDGGAASGFVVDDGYLSASEVRNDVDGDGDDAADGEPDGELTLLARFGRGPPSLGMVRNSDQTPCCAAVGRRMHVKTGFEAKSSASTVVDRQH